MTHVMLWRSSLPGLRKLGQTPPACCIWVAMVFIIKSFLKSTLRLLPPCSLSVIFFSDTALALVYPLFSPHKLFSSAINFVAHFMKSSLNSIYRNLVPGDMPESQINLKSLVCAVMDSLYMKHCWFVLSGLGGALWSLESCGNGCFLLGPPSAGEGCYITRASNIHIRIGIEELSGEAAWTLIRLVLTLQIFIHFSRLFQEEEIKCITSCWVLYVLITPSLCAQETIQAVFISSSRACL